MIAPVRKIISQSTVDGPGNRTAIFLQGCNIRCSYCHNPETQAMEDAEASERTVPEVVEEIRKSIPFIRGITVSGGECMLRAEWLKELFTAVRHLSDETGHFLTCLIDSNGTVPFSSHRPLMDVCDGVMLDVKAWDSVIYQRLTQSANNRIVKDNLTWLLQEDKLTEVRIVCVPEMVDVEVILNNIAQIYGFIGKSAPIKLIRFRPHGVIGALSAYPVTSEEAMNHYISIAESLHLPVRKG